jgi:8-oxo-dGTP pyrophosphatase MutT (NUDIX family)
MESVERARLDTYFSKITTRFRPDEQPSSFLVTHLLPERPSFIRGVAAASTLRAVLPKPKSISPAAKREVEGIVQCDPLSREVFADADQALEYFENRARGERLVLLDVGGYFASTLNALRELAEETGIDPGLVTPVSPVPLHIDVHPIPANPAKDEPGHQHFDFRFLFRTEADVTALQAEEILNHSWQFTDQITAEPLRSRLLAVPAR